MNNANACGDCGMCCKLLAIETLHKAAGPTCRYFERGCSIYEDRPDECRGFSCAWLKSERLPPESRLGPEWRPDRSNFIMYTDCGGLRLNVVAHPDHPLAWKREPFFSFIERMRDRANEGFEVLIYSGSPSVVQPGRPPADS